MLKDIFSPSTEFVNKNGTVFGRHEHYYELNQKNLCECGKKKFFKSPKYKDCKKKEHIAYSLDRERIVEMLNTLPRKQVLVEMNMTKAVLEKNYKKPKYSNISKR